MAESLTDFFKKSFQKVMDLQNNAPKNTEPVSASEKINIQDLSVPGSVAYDTATGDTYYTYKKGDTFGQVIQDLGLATDNGLWGSNGDVAYYANQLRDQGIMGSVPVGTTIKLRKRE